jgi:hypothetical protein
VLKSVDVLIGLTVVLLALSMAVTVITQAITTVLNSRGRHLRRGIVDLLQLLDPSLTAGISKSVATAVLTHPLVSGSSAPLLGGRIRLGNIVHREELTKLLMAMATGDGSRQLEPTAREVLKRALANNGISNPDDTLKTIRGVALQLERASPQLSHTMRQNMAILRAAESDFVAKVNTWFDQTMDRTSQRFTASTRAITFAGAFIVAFGLQVDTPSLVNRLAADESLRNAFVQEAQALQKTEMRAAADIDRQYRAFLATNGIITLPTGGKWREGFESKNLLGMLVTALLLSLGAPFWYSALGRLLQLRSVLAAKDDAQRTERQSIDGMARAAGAERVAAVE